MIYSCNTEGGYITATCVSLNVEQAMTHRITEEEYLRIEAARKEYPRDGRVYQLRTDLTWEPIPEEPETYTEEALLGMTNAELTEILAGLGISATMNKNNMVRLILAMQVEE